MSSNIMSGRKSVFKGELSLGPVVIPLALYKTVDPFTVKTHTYHEGCDQRCVQPLMCPDHPKARVDLGTLETWQGVDFGETVIMLDPDDRKDILGTKSSMEYVSSHPMNQLTQLINSGKIMPIFTYMAFPPPDVTGVSKNGLATLLERMRVKRRFIMCKVGLGTGIERHIILLPSGLVYGLAYSEEMREFPEIDGDINREVGKWLDEHILGGDGKFEQPSAKKIITRVTRFFTKKVKEAMESNRKVNV